MTKLAKRLFSEILVFLLLFTIFSPIAAPAYAEEGLGLEEYTEEGTEFQTDVPVKENAESVEATAEESIVDEPVPATSPEEEKPAVQEPASVNQASAKKSSAGQAGVIEASDTHDDGVLTPGSAVEEYDEVYVASYGDDEQGDGSADLPFATLARAAEAANASPWNTVYVCLLTDLEVAQTARFYGKQVYLLGENDQVLLTRRVLFEPAEDDVRGVYNPAMIEVGMPASPDEEATPATGLTLENVILDDTFTHEGDVFRLPILNVENKQINKNTVQEAIIAAYGNAEIVLRDSAVLNNYGGMSAVRVTEGASLVVENGAVVQDTEDTAPVAGTSEFLSDGDSNITVEEYAIVVPRGGSVVEPEEEIQAEKEMEAEVQAVPAAVPVLGAAPLLGAASDEQSTEDNQSESDENETVTTEGNTETAGAEALRAAASSDDIFVTVTIETERDYITDEDMIADVEIPYTVTIQFSDLITVAEPLITAFDMTVTIAADSRLNLKETDSVVLTADTDHGTLTLGEVTQDGNTLTAKINKTEGTGLSSPFRLYFTGILPQDSFEAGKIIETRAEEKYEINFSSKDIPNQGSSSTTLSLQMLNSGSATLHYDANGGTGAPADVTAQPQDNYALDTTTVPTHADEDGKPVLFLGWTTEQSTQIYAHGDVAPTTVTAVTLAPEGTTVYAAYGYDEFGDDTTGGSDGSPDINQSLVVLSFDADGGSDAPKSIGKALIPVFGTKFNIPEEEPKRTGFAFQGWSETKGGEKKYRYNKTDQLDDDLIIHQDTALYAVWQQVANYIVEFDANGGTGAPAAVARVTRIIQLPDETPTRSGYVFDGWAKTSTATSAEYKAGSLFTAEEANTTLYAVWKEEGSIDPVDPSKKITYTLYYNANGGTNAPVAQTGTADADGVVHLTITSSQPTRSGYAFKGWATTRRGDASYFAGEKVRISGGNVTLYAVWERDASNGRAPKTGDESNIPLYIALLVVSLAAIVFLIRIIRKRKHK